MAYTYDNDSRVSGLTYSAGSTNLGNLSYSYDAAGRRTTVGGSLAAVTLPASVAGGTSTSYNADNEQTKFNRTSHGYDANGNLLSDGTNSYTWDARGHLTGVSGGATASFVYDAFGRRMKKTVGSTVTQFLYDGLNPVQELNGSGGVAANLLTWLKLDEYFTRTDSSGTMAFLADALGSTVGLVNAGGSIGTSYTHQPFGAATVSGTNGNPYQFTGRENDGTGLYFYRARYYSPTFQRFIAQDPIGFAGGDPNVYGYVSGDPTGSADPLGLLAFTIFGQSVKVDFSVTIANIIISYDLAGFSPSDLSVNVQAGLSVGASLDFSINPPSPCQPYVSPYVGYGRNLSFGTNVVSDPETGSYSLQGFNLSIGLSAGLPVGVVFPFPGQL